jgi:hypothetical protein
LGPEDLTLLIKMSKRFEVMKASPEVMIVGYGATMDAYA